MVPTDHEAVQRLESIPRVSLSTLDSPIEPCPRIGRHVDGMPALFVKRDDSVGSLVGGNKLRKLEYSMAHAIAIGATTVLTVGGVHSNMARITAQVSRRLGLKCELVLSGEPPERASGNALINQLLGVPVHHVDAREDRAAAMRRLAARLRSRGETVMAIPLGASDEIGSLGFVRAMGEFARQQTELGMRFDTIYFSTSSGGTQAGLEIGKRLFGLDDLALVGVSADNSRDMIADSVTAVANQMAERLELATTIDAGDLDIDVTQVGDGYGIATDLSTRATRLFAETEGILLDPIYTGKAAAAILDRAERGGFAPDDRVLFWHTGGLMNLFQ